MLKSTACAFSAATYFSDNLPDISVGKDVSQHLRGKWLIEVGEMHAMAAQKRRCSKPSLPGTSERYRPSYGRLEVIEPRQCVFIGTTNRDTYLRDETGGRRFWPVRSATIDIDALRRTATSSSPRPSVAIGTASRGGRTKDFEREHIVRNRRERYEADVWEEGIREDISRLRRGLLLASLARDALYMETARVSRRQTSAGLRRRSKRLGLAENRASRRDL